MRFDALGRAWIWNTVSVSGYPSKPRLGIFAKEAGTWTRIQTVKAKKLTVNTLRFASDGKAFATNSRKNEIVIWRVTESGTVRKERRVALRGRSIPLDAFPNADGSLFVPHGNRIDEFVLPLRRKERPVRTIRAEFRNFSKLVALADGTVFVMQGDNNYLPVEVYGSDQSGVSDPTRTILIDPSRESSQHPTHIALTPNGKVAVLYWGSGVALFETTADGNSVTPATWYPQWAPMNVQGVDFGPNGVMGVVDFGASTAVKVFFEAMCAPRPGARC
jgi:WD40 repeat protein